jgi:hypothetical protein
MKLTSAGFGRFPVAVGAAERLQKPRTPALTADSRRKLRILVAFRCTGFAIGNITASESAVSNLSIEFPFCESLKS